MAELVKKRTKRDIESERKRKKIYEEGIKLFRTYGYDNTTLEDIRQASGMSRGSIYHFFSKKRDILYYFFAETSKEAMNSLVINDENLMKPAQAIRDYTVKVAEANEALGYDLACVMQDAYLDASDDTRFSSKFVHDIAVFIEAAQEKGTCKGDIDPIEAAHCIHIASAGMFRKWIIDSGKFPLGAATEWYMPFIINDFVEEKYKVTRTGDCPVRFKVL